MITHMDNWSMYGGVGARLLDGVYAQSLRCDLLADPDGISAGWAARLGSTGSGLLRHVLPENVTISGQAMRVWLVALPSSSSMHPAPICWKDAGNNFLYSVTVTTTGRLEVRTGGPTGTILMTTTNPVITADGWYHFEGKLEVDAAAGSIEVRVEGITVIDLSGINTGVTAVSQVEINNIATGTGADVLMYIKDFVVWNGDGTHNTDFLGSVIVAGLVPTADVDLNWTPSTGAVGFSILDNRPPIDTQYIGAPNPPPPAYVCELSDLPPDVTSVKAIMTMVRAAKTDGGDASLQIGVISDPDGSPATALGEDRPITVAQTYWRDVFEEDPVTSAPWLPDAVDAAELQIDRTT
jgi:hypothetical protein